MLDKQTRWGIVLYKELGRLTGGLIPEFQADLDAMQHGLGFTDHACDVVPLLINCHKQYKKNKS